MGRAPDVRHPVPNAGRGGGRPSMKPETAELVRYRLVTFDRKEVNAWVHEAGRFVEQLARSVEGLSH